MFYEDGVFPVDLIGDHLGQGIERGAALAIVTSDHQLVLRAALEQRAVAVDAALVSGRLSFVDAAQALAALEVEGTMNEATFEATFGRLVSELCARSGPLWVFGEVVELLCKRTDLHEAVRLEDFWNKLLPRYPLRLLCAYALRSFEDASTHAGFESICGAHDGLHVHLGGSAAAVRAPAAIIAHLEQRRQALRHEIERRQELEAERARQQRAEQFLAEAARLFASSLDYEATVARVAQLAVPSFADWCLVDLVTDDGLTFERVAVGHHRPGGEEVARMHRRRYPVRPDIQQGLARTLVERKTLLLRDVDEALLQAIARDDEHLRACRALAMRSCVNAPMVARGRTIGALSLIACERNFTERDVPFVEQLALSAAAAIDNARLYEAERRGRMRLAKMQEVTAALSLASTSHEVAAATCRIGSDAVQAHSAALWLLRDDGSLVLAGSWGLPDEFIEPFRLLPTDATGTPALEVVRTGEPLWIETEEDYRRTAPRIFELVEAAGRLASYGAVPLMLDGRVAGVLSFGHPSGHVYDQGERDFYVALGHNCSQALHRARLLDAERRSNERLRLLAQAGETLARSLELAETLRAVAKLFVPAVADWFVIDLVEGSAIRRIAIEHPDPEKVRLAEQIASRHQAHLGDGSPIAQAIAGARSHFLPRVPAKALEAAARDADERRLMDEEGVVSSILVPLLVRDECIGTVSLTTTTLQSGRVFDQEDVDFVEELGRRAGLAIANARMHAIERAARAEAEAANHIKDEFLATVSHELRTPLHAIRGWAELVAQRPHDVDGVRKGLAIIQRNVQTQIKIVDDILDVSRIITGKLKIEPTPVDMVAIVRDALDVVRPSADARRLRLSFTPPAEASCWLVGDAQRLQQAIWNLLSNAVKFTEPGGEVQAQVEQDGAVVTVTVTDTGRGIDVAFLPHVFERFRQADSSTTRKFGGLGLGLSLVRHIVELHGGQVWAESAGLGRGASFRLVLPVRAVAPVSAEDSPPSSAAVSAQMPTEANIRGLRVLVVDDEDDARELLRVALGQEGADVQTAASAQEALAALDCSVPDVIVSDIGMPGEDGYGLLQEVRQRGLAIAAIALTAYTRTSDRQRALEAGFAAHLKKPVDARQLIGAIAAVHRGLRGQ